MRFCKLLFQFLILFQAKLVFSQADTILAFPAEKQMLALLRAYRSDLAFRDSQQAITALAEAEKLFAEKGDKLLQRQAWLLQQLHNASGNPVAEKGASMMLKAANIAASKNWSLTQAECWHFAGSIYFKGGMFVPAFEYMRKAQNIFDKYDSEKYPYILRYADGIAGCYYQFGEYREAIRYLKKTVSLPSYWNSLIYFPSVNNTLGLCACCTTHILLIKIFVLGLAVILS